MVKIIAYVFRGNYRIWRTCLLKRIYSTRVEYIYIQINKSRSTSCKEFKKSKIGIYAIIVSITEYFFRVRFS